MQRKIANITLKQQLDILNLEIDQYLMADDIGKNIAN